MSHGGPPHPFHSDPRLSHPLRPAPGGGGGLLQCRRLGPARPCEPSRGPLGPTGASCGPLDPARRAPCVAAPLSIFFQFLLRAAQVGGKTRWLTSFCLSVSAAARALKACRPAATQAPRCAASRRERLQVTRPAAAPAPPRATRIGQAFLLRWNSGHDPERGAGRRGGRA